MPSNEEQKEILKQALHEWLDEKFTVFGKWSFGLFAAATFFALSYFILSINGWKGPF